MLVKIKKAEDGRWIIQAIDGEFANWEIAIAEAVYIRKARFHEKHITGLLVQSAGVEGLPQIVGTDTEKQLSVSPEGIGDHFNTQIYHICEGQWETENGRTIKSGDRAPHLRVTRDDMSISMKTMRPVFRGVPLGEFQVEEETHRPTFLQRLRG